VIEIAGNTDNVGNPAANMSLSQRRAEAVRDGLVQAGVNPSMLTARGYGSTNPPLRGVPQTVGRSSV
jgi:OOP family OmpA-OmpF porin